MNGQSSRKISFGILVVSCVLNASLFSQSDTAKKKHDYQLRIIPLPVIASNPTNGWMFGVAPGATWSMGDTSNTSLSSMLGTLIYTTKKQWINTFKANTFF